MAHDKTKKLVLVAMCASIICLLAQITIPLPLIPITGQTLAIGVVATILGSSTAQLQYWSIYLSVL